MGILTLCISVALVLFSTRTCNGQPGEIGFYIETKDLPLPNGTTVLRTDIGVKARNSPIDNSLQCTTDNTTCCNDGPVAQRPGEFYFPDNKQVPGFGPDVTDGYYRTRGVQFIRLNRDDGTITGQFRCEIPDNKGDIVKLVVNVVDFTSLDITESGINTAGEKYTLECTGTVDGTAGETKFMWSGPGVSDEKITTSGTMSTLTFDKLSHDDAGDYTCIWILGASNFTKDFTVTVDPAPTEAPTTKAPTTKATDPLTTKATTTKPTRAPTTPTKPPTPPPTEVPTEPPEIPKVTVTFITSPPNPVLSGSEQEFNCIVEFKTKNDVEDFNLYAMVPNGTVIKLKTKMETSTRFVFTFVDKSTQPDRTGKYTCSLYLRNDTYKVAEDSLHVVVGDGLFQLRMKSVDICDHWRHNYNIGKRDKSVYTFKNYIEYALVKAIEMRCKCHFPYKHLLYEHFLCQESPNLLTYRNILVDTDGYDSTEIIDFIQDWVSTGPTIWIDGVSVKVQNCTAAIDSINDPECGKEACLDDQLALDHPKYAKCAKHLSDNGIKDCFDQCINPSA